MDSRRRSWQHPYDSHRNAHHSSHLQGRSTDFQPVNRSSPSSYRIDNARYPSHAPTASVRPQRGNRSPLRSRRDEYASYAPQSHISHVETGQGHQQSHPSCSDADALPPSPSRPGTRPRRAGVTLASSGTLLSNLPNSYNSHPDFRSNGPHRSATPRGPSRFNSGSSNPFATMPDASRRASPDMRSAREQPSGAFRTPQTPIPTQSPLRAAHTVSLWSNYSANTRHVPHSDSPPPRCLARSPAPLRPGHRFPPWSDHESGQLGDQHSHNASAPHYGNSQTQFCAPRLSSVQPDTGTGDDSKVSHNDGISNPVWQASAHEGHLSFNIKELKRREAQQQKINTIFQTTIDELKDDIRTLDSEINKEKQALDSLRVAHNEKVQAKVDIGSRELDKERMGA
nr:uncharacterized protein CI109_007366 [Kwoniella shandongensis]KAA5524319.1 hypothetical protein CI109_007366 [Kwoniella shandongensis]